MKHISIGLETLGLSTGAAIVSIGAVVFNPDSGTIVTRAYWPIKLEDSLAFGKVDASTLCWWMRQEDEARAVFNDPLESTHTFDEALHALHNIFQAHQIEYVWFNGPMEDGTWLKSLYEKRGADLPWRHTRTRDMRTLIDMAMIDLNDLPEIGTSHNAVDDAEFQAVAIIRAYQKIRSLVSADKEY